MTTQITSYDGRRVRAVLDAQGIRQDWLAAQAGVSRAHLSRIVKGERLASRPVAERIASTLRVPFSLAFELPTCSKPEPKGSAVTEPANAAD